MIAAYTLRLAAHKLDCSEATIMTLINSGKLEHVRLFAPNGINYSGVTEESLERVNNEKATLG